MSHAVTAPFILQEFSLIGSGERSAWRRTASANAEVFHAVNQPEPVGLSVTVAVTLPVTVTVS